MAEYLSQLEERRGQEHDPFHPRNNAFYLTSREIRVRQKMKREKDRLLLSDHYSRRLSQAYSLMNELLLESGPLPARPEAAPLPMAHGSGSPRRENQHSQHFPLSQTGKSRFLPKGKKSFGQHQGFPWPRGTATFSIQKKSGDTKMAVRKSTQFPVTIHKDWRSRLNPREMSPDVKKRSCHRHSWMKQESHAGAAPAPAAKPAYSGFEREETVVSPWTVSPDIQKILQQSHTSLLDLQSAEEEAPELPAGVSGWESTSESTGSLLSSLDWNAIDNMVASVEDKSSLVHWAQDQ